MYFTSVWGVFYIDRSAHHLLALFHDKDEAQAYIERAKRRFNYPNYMLKELEVI